MSIELYPSIAKIKRNGVYENLPGFVPETGSVATQQMIATAESSATAQYVHTMGEYFRLNDTLYQAIVRINVGDTIVVGTNCEVAVLGNDVTHIANSIAEYELGIATSAHATGEYFMVGETMYVATANIQIGDSISTSTNCRKAVVGDELSGLKTSVRQINDNLPEAEMTGSIAVLDGGAIKQITVDAPVGTASSVITRCGKNIIPKFSSGSGNGLSWTVADDGTLSFTGTPSADTYARIYNTDIPLTVGSIFSLAFFNNLANSRLSFFFVTSNGNPQINLDSVNKTGTVSAYVSDTRITEIRIRIPKDFDATGLTIKPIAIVGASTPESYEQYNGESFNVSLNSGIVQENIPLLSGTNTIWASNGNITVTLIENVVNYVDEEIDSVVKYVDEEINGVRNSFYRYISNNGKYLFIYFKSGEHYVRWELHNVPAPQSNSDTWQIGRICGVNDTDDTGLVEIVRGGEFELAFKENGAADYCGGNNHGDETTDTFLLHIDGKQIDDLTTLDSDVHPFTRIDAFEIATVNRCDTPSEDILKHQKIWIFEDGKVKVRQTIKYLEELVVDTALVCMFAALRSAYPYGVRKGGVAIEDMTTAEYTKVYTTSDDVFYEYYGANATAKVHAKTDNPENKSVMWINNTVDLNKLYYGYYGVTNSSNPTTVPVDTVITAESEYDVAYTPST